jgi:predicted XRE-type DNA-binding protein
MDELCDLIVEKTQVDAAEFLGVSQPRISALKREKFGLFTIDALVNMLARAGVRLRISFSR